MFCKFNALAAYSFCLHCFNLELESCSAQACAQFTTRSSYHWIPFQLLRGTKPSVTASSKEPIAVSPAAALVCNLQGRFSNSPKLELQGSVLLEKLYLELLSRRAADDPGLLLPLPGAERASVHLPAWARNSASHLGCRLRSLDLRNLKHRGIGKLLCRRLRERAFDVQFGRSGQ